MNAPLLAAMDADSKERAYSHRSCFGCVECATFVTQSGVELKSRHRHHFVYETVAGAVGECVGHDVAASGEAQLHRRDSGAAVMIATGVEDSIHRNGDR